jgi:alkylation response protein AidB-like acyl-CoA dehydrogenase
MATTGAELLSMADTLRKALGADTERPAPDSEWRGRWPALAELGIAAFCVPEECEGFGNEVPAALTAAREFGAALHGSPYPAVVAASYALSRWLEGDQRGQVTADVMAGTHVPTLAFLDSGATVTEQADGLRVDGRAYLVAGAGDADSFLALPPDGDTLLFIRRADTCTTVRVHEFDVTRSCADVAFTGALALPVTVEPGGRSRVERLHGLLLAGDALGGMGRMLDRTVAYARGRTAFGKAIGGYQAVQHRLVDHTTALRGMSLLAEEAAGQVAAQAPGAGRTVLLTEGSVAAAAVPLLHDLLQLTGAIAFTWEYGLHLYERRAHLDARLGGNPRQARRALAEREGWTSPE